MAIKLVSINDKEANGVCATLYSDTKEEVPAKGAATVAKGLSDKLLAPSYISTAKLEVGVLDSDDNWNW